MSGLWKQFKKEMFQYLTRKQQEGAYQAFAWLERQEKIPSEDALKNNRPPDRFLVVTMSDGKPDGEEHVIDVRALSVAYGTEKGRALDMTCLGADVELAAKFREMDDEQVIAEAGELPLGAVIALHMSYRQKFLPLRKAVESDDFMDSVDREKAAAILNTYTQRDWAMAKKVVVLICDCGDHLEKRSEKARGMCDRCCDFDELSEDGQ